MIGRNKDEDRTPKAGFWMAVAIFMVAVASVIGFNQGGASASDHGGDHSDDHTTEVHSEVDQSHVEDADHDSGH